MLLITNYLYINQSIVISNSSIKAGLAVILLLMSSTFFVPIHTRFSDTQVLTMYKPLLPRLLGEILQSFLPSKIIMSDNKGEHFFSIRRASIPDISSISLSFLLDMVACRLIINMLYQKVLLMHFEDRIPCKKVELCFIDVCKTNIVSFLKQIQPYIK